MTSAGNSAPVGLDGQLSTYGSGAGGNRSLRYIWKQIGGELPHADWEVYPTTPWNYGLAVTEETVGDAVDFEEREVGDGPFSPEGAPVVATVKGRLVPEWIIEHSAAAPPPQSPVTSTQTLVDLKLIPYGSTNLRVTEFPVVE